MVRLEYAAVWALVWLLTACSTGRTDATPDEIRLANEASQGAVATVQARVRVTIQFNPATNQNASRTSFTDKYLVEYARAGAKERIKESGGPIGVRDVIRDSQARKGSVFVPKPDKKFLDTAYISYDTRADALEIWEWVLFELPECKQPLSQLLAAGVVKSIKSVTHAGRSLIYLDIHDPKRSRFDSRYEVWVDPSVNHLVRRLVYHSSRPLADISIEREVLSFREVTPGVFFPEKVAHSLLSNGNWFEKVEAILSEIRLNQRLPEGTFTHKFPPGTRVADYERGTSYTVGPAGQPTKAAPLDPEPPPAPLATSTPPDADEERWPWHRIVLLLSLAIVLAGLGAVYWKRRFRPS